MIKQLLKSVREYRRDSILSPLFVTLEVVMEVVIPLMMAHLIDYGVTGGDMGVVGRTGIALFFSALTALAFGVLSGKYAASASSGFAKNLRRDIYRQIQDFSFSNIDKFSASGLVTRLTTDVSNVQNAFQMIIRVAVRAPVMLILSLVAAFGISARLSLVFLAFIPFLGAGIYLLMTNAHPLVAKALKFYDRLNGVVQENLRGIRVVKSFVREEGEIAKFRAVSGDIYENFVRAEKIIALTNPLMQFCMYGCTLLISWFGAKLVVADALSTGELMGLIAYIGQILMSLMMLSMVLLMTVISRASALRIAEVLSEESDIENPAQPVYEVQDGSIEFDGVGFCYAGEGGKPCLESARLAIRSGETVGILGGTGSGKTTLTQLIPRLYDATSGTVRVGGVDVRDYDLETLRNNVSIVLQKNELFSGTVKENLRWGRADATDDELVHACRLAQAHDFVEGFPDGYDTSIEQGGANLSGGQKQRLCIARALLKSPKILILDDSTSAVDTKTDALIQRAFAQEIPHITKIVIAQRVSSIQNADKIVVMDDGRIDSVGTHEELLQSCLIYREVYESQTKGEKILDAA